MEHIIIEGWLYNTESSERQPANVSFSAEGLLTIELKDAASPVSFRNIRISECTFSDRIGNTPRFVSHAGFGRFETRDNEQVDRVLRHYHQQGVLKQGLFAKLAHSLESNLRVVLLTVLITVIAGFLFVRVGVPWGAKQIASALPEEIVRSVGSGSLDLLDNFIFTPSNLSNERQQKLRRSLLSIAENSGISGVRLEFRYSEELGANAFALPDATIVFLDDMVELAESDEELAAIMLHELGHVEHRHAVRRLIQQSGLGLMVLLAIGDVSAASQLVVALPTLLIDAHYSREMEREADDYAFQRMRESGIAVNMFARIMRKVIEAEKPVDAEHDAGYEDRASSLLATHPNIEERLRRFE